MSYYINKNLLILFIILNVIIGSLGGINQTSLRKLIAFSSINNLGWILSALIIRENLWIFYFIIYTFLIRIICFLFYIINLLYINQIYNLNINFYIKISILINFFSLGGLPPFLGFFPKWIIINFLINNNLYLISFVFIIIRLIILFFYVRIIYSSLLFFNFKFKWFKIFIKNKSLIYINYFNFLSLLGIIYRSLFFF